MSSAHGYPASFLGIVSLPDLVAKNQSAGHALQGVHFILTNALVLFGCRSCVCGSEAPFD
jgi:cytochrome b561